MVTDEISGIAADINLEADPLMDVRVIGVDRWLRGKSSDGVVPDDFSRCNFPGGVALYHTPSLSSSISS